MPLYLSPLIIIDSVIFIKLYNFDHLFEQKQRILHFLIKFGLLFLFIYIFAIKYFDLKVRQLAYSLFNGLVRTFENKPFYFEQLFVNL
jgi:hypothetical protein